MTKEEILKRVKDQVEFRFLEKDKELTEKIEEARAKEDYQRVGILHDRWLNGLWGDKYGFFLRQVTIKEVEAATGLSYQIVYNKILPILREAGYEIVTERQV